MGIVLPLLCAFIPDIEALWLPSNGTVLSTGSSVAHGLVSCDQSLGSDLDKFDCERLIRRLPFDREGEREHVFSRTMGDPVYRLPAIKLSTHTMININLLMGARSDVTSWSRIREGLLEILTSCEQPDGRIFGGQRIAGDSLHMILLLSQGPINAESMTPEPVIYNASLPTLNGEQTQATE